MAKKFSKVADELQARLIARGFTIHRYDAFSSDSVYLKLDYGACGSIRISDHKGYKHLSYMWNIGTWIIRERHEIHEVRPRHFYPVGSMSAMVEAICDLRDRRQSAGDYERRIDIGKRCKATARTGFWANGATRLVS